MSLPLLITIALVVVILAVAAGVTARTRAVKPVVAGLGWAGLVAGWYLTGLTALTINGIVSIIEWFQRTVFTTAVAWGLGLVIGGVVFVIASAFLPKGERATKPSTGKSAVGAAPAPQVGRARQGTATAKTSGRAPAAGAPALDPEDAEIEEMLRKRGIM